MENFEFKSQNSAEEDRHLPLIDGEEQRFIENTGGEYAGYIRSGDGKKRYEQFRIDRRAHYDEERREIIETYIATEAIDEEGEKDLRSPADTAGFSVLISDLSRSGEELGRPQILEVRATDFKQKRMVAAELEVLAREVHALVSQKALMLDSVALRSAVEKYLHSLGWEQ